MNKGKGFAVGSGNDEIIFCFIGIFKSTEQDHNTLLQSERQTALLGFVSICINYLISGAYSGNTGHKAGLIPNVTSGHCSVGTITLHTPPHTEAHLGAI